jgi:S1-C subfamily serine protease
MATVIILATVAVIAADWTRVAREARDGIPRLEVSTEDGRSGKCSAVVVAAPSSAIGLALTAAHCVNSPKDTITINGRDAHFVKANKILDLALVAFDPKHEKPIPLAPEAPETGAEVLMAGYPFGSETFHVQTGTVSAPYDRDCKCLKLDVNVIPGDSGGAVLDSQGRLIGLTTGMHYNGPSHLALAVPVDAIRDFAKVYLPKQP